MVSLKKYNMEGQEVGDVAVDDRLANAEANGQMIKDYIVAIRANARQWSANTKTRSEVNHSTKKPHPQKGGGRSRQGSLAAPQYKGGGRVFGPRPKFDQHVKINKRERQAAIRFLLAEKIKDNKVKIITDTKLKSPKTKTVAGFLKNSGIGGRVLFLGEGSFAKDEDSKISVYSDKHHNFIRSLQNIPKVEFSLAQNINGYDVMVAHEIVLTESALHEIVEWLC